MPDREKVIRGLECCKSTYDWSNGLPWKNCPYSNEKECGDCGINQMFDDALALLKQEAVEAEYEGDARSTWWWVCGECHTTIEDKDKFCKECGRRILWGK